MKKINLILVLCLCMSIASIANAQNMLYLEIQQVKENNVAFTTLPNVFKPASPVSQSANAFLNLQAVSWFEYIPVDLENQWAISFAIPKNGGIVEVELIEAPDICYQYDVVTSDGKEYPANRDKHYRGIVKDDSNSLVAMTFFNGEIMGMIATEKGNFTIGKEQVSGKYLLYNSANLSVHPGFSCGTIEDDVEHLISYI
jgi:hypothetical protein